jgi:5'' nucleotidase, deoxy (Pyrimidine), cytosolic type C protein (NT5C).
VKPAGPVAVGDKMTVNTNSLEGVIIGVDLDGVCSDFFRIMREVAAEWFERPIDELTTDVSYGLHEWGIKTKEQYKSLHRFAVTQRGLFKASPMIPGARKFLRLMSDEGARVRIITHRLYISYFHHDAVSQTIDWLDEKGIPYWDLCFMKAKEQVGANIYIEDAPENIENLRKKGFFTICFGNTTNKTVHPPRAENWQQVYELVHEQVKNLRLTAK